MARSDVDQANEEPQRATPLARFLILIVRFYQATLSRVLGGHCRFQPTCSVYAIEALRAHGGLRGSWLTLRRLARCHPFGGHGFDPVPPCRTHRPSLNSRTK